MIKYTKSFIEKQFLPGVFGEDEIEEIEERDPHKVQYDGSMIGFRFFDVDFIEDNGKIFESDSYNYSKRYVFGQKFSYDEIVEMYGNDPNHRILIMNMEGNHINFVGRNNHGGFFEIKDDDIMYDELVEEIVKSIK